MKTWAEHPVKTDAEANVCHYFGLFRAGKILEAEELLDHTPVRHVLSALWRASVAANADAEEASRGSAAREWERNLSWLSELDLGDFRWGAGGHFSVDVTYRAQITELELGFCLKPTDAGWVVGGPFTYW